ncbi:hypothetical protein FQA39_LY00100 [Lamprigera yunnana]|nr:hypothetical protein FQA39_LY00100 [Lamprigera yunnana]
MSADIENNKEDGKPQENEVEKDLKSRILNKWSMGLKLLELVICTVCVISAICTFVMVVPLHEVVKAILLAVSSSYFILTFVEAIVFCVSKPIMWTSWLPLSILGSLLFFLCTGILITAKDCAGTIIYEITVLVFTAAGIFFLSDALYILRHHVTLIGELSLSSIALRVNKDEQCSTSSDNQSNKSTQIILGYHKLVHDSMPVSTPQKLQIKQTAASHGGTFHVSKTVVPISTTPRTDVFKKPEAICVYKPKTAPTNLIKKASPPLKGNRTSGRYCDMSLTQMCALQEETPPKKVHISPRRLESEIAETDLTVLTLLDDNQKTESKRRFEKHPTTEEFETPYRCISRNRKCPIKPTRSEEKIKFKGVSKSFGCSHQSPGSARSVVDDQVVEITSIPGSLEADTTITSVFDYERRTIIDDENVIIKTKKNYTKPIHDSSETSHK